MSSLYFIDSIILLGCSRDTVTSSKLVITHWDDVQSYIDNAYYGDTIDLTSLHTSSVSRSIELFIPENIGLHFKMDPENLKYVYGVGYGVAFICLGNNQITFENMSIWYTGDSVNSALSFRKGNNSLMLVGENRIGCLPEQFSVTNSFGAAVSVPESVSLTICGEGSLEACGANGGSGIGGGYNANCGKLTINNCRVSAYGGYMNEFEGGAGIGGGSGGDGGVIEINNADIIACGKNGGAGIGGGYNGAGGSVIITSGTVAATFQSGAAGIGGGSLGCGGTIEISGGYTTVSGEGGGAGIGGGYGYGGCEILISGGEVEVVSGDRSAAIGNGLDGDGSQLTIISGSLTAISYGEPKQPAINARVDLQANDYKWKAGSISSAPAKNNENMFPGDFFINNNDYQYVYITTVF
jgi:hypothetical protein